MASVVTAKGREVITGRMKGATPTQVEPNVIAWGIPSAQFTSAVSDVALFAETAEARVTGTSSFVTTTTTNDTYQVVGTLTASASRAVTEVALADSTTKPTGSTVTGGTAVGSAVGTTLTTAGNVTATTIQVRTEVMTVTAGSGTSSLTVTRGANGSTAIATIASSDVVTPGNIPGVTTITGGTLLAHYDFAVINLNSGDTLQSTVQVKFT